MDTLLSVCLITYNHHAYIRQAVDSVLMQRADFPWELVIADDGSTDGTREQLIAFRQQHPERIRLILQPQNVGAYQNWMELIAYPRSRYIAYLDGDDYWTDPFKLQKQVDFLENNPDYVICAHEIFTQEGERPVTEKKAGGQGLTLTIDDLATRGNLIPTLSVVYRRAAAVPLPAWAEQAPLGDYIFNLFLATRGKIMVLPDHMGVYRRHAKGLWSGLQERKHYENMIAVLSLLATSTFSPGVIRQLNAQKRHYATLYLKLLLETDRGQFEQQLRELTEGDAELGREWLLTHLPEYIFWLKGSRSFRFSRTLSKIAAGIKRNIIR